MKNFIENAAIALFCLFVAFIVGGFFYSRAHYRYEVTVPDGRYSTSYYTNAYRKRGECLYFIQGGYQDTTQVCGTFRIQQINK